ncbi:hypothetical protein BO71DRAFT_110284 [Aspergillus ellipticus CBS 707.79]|uniref:Peptidase S53 activation domain-containing protein n=1 Tax=Aspergillus ellipticus CBS 707.79 TaxID=1448320 RepID=A0A319DE96_9EURO|nr:hypothetical protein BO71DRAFT_110284 [Aspergillus ellipticus CBS 707.79]
MRSSGLYAALLGSLAASTNAVVHEKLAAVPYGWHHVEDAGDNHQVSLSIALARQNLDQLETKLKAVSTPGQAQYGQWLDQEDIDSLFPVASDKAVISWLRSANITHIARQGSLVNFAATVGQVNQLLNTTFAYYQSGRSQRLRTTEYSVPSELTDSIDLISPTTFFGKENTNAGLSTRAHKLEKHAAYKRSNSSSCAELITLSCLKDMYSFGNYTPSVSSGSKVAFSSFLNQSASFADLASFERLFNVPYQEFSVELINGGTNDQNSSTASLTEADLDVELLVGVAHPLPVTEFITAGTP